MISEIRTLNPKPGLAFGSEPVTPVVPDVFVRQGPAGWIVDLVRLTAPAVRRTRVDESQRRIGEPAGDLICLDRVAAALARALEAVAISKAA